MQHEQYADAIRREGLALASAARDAGVDAPVPSCPKWNVGDLVSHLGRVHRYVTRIVSEHSTERGAHWSETEAPPAAERIDWFVEGATALADALRAAGPDVACWTWMPDKSSGFWARRQANETAVHRWDAQLAAEATEPIERDLAIDGINELFDLVPYWPRADQVRGNGETLHFHCTDGEGEWLVRLGTDELVITREHAKGDVAARGSASDLLLFLYGRVPPEQLEVFGDASLLARWRELVSW